MRWSCLASFLIGHAGAQSYDIANSDVAMTWVRNYTGLDHAGYAFLADEFPGQLVLTRFGAAPFVGKSQVSLVDIASGKHTNVATKIDWPNEATMVDKKVFGFKAIIVGAGFLVPSHTSGGIWIINADSKSEEAVKITKDYSTPFHPDSGWFFHQAEMRDMNGDGLLDIVTSRCAYSVEPWNKKQGKLIWLEQPKTGALSGHPWEEHQIQDGPDFIFSLVPAAPEKPAEIEGCAAEYITGKLVYFYGSEASGYSTRLLDADLVHGFGCTWTDLNGDGKLDLLATNHLMKDGSVFAYSWDGDLKDPATKIQKHVLATNFSALTQSAGQASPGDAIPFFAKTETKTGKPLIFVSGDNGNDIYILSPKNGSDTQDWTYEKQRLLDLGADVGRIAIGDTDGDGYNEFFIPAYDLGNVVHYKFGPKKAQGEIEKWCSGGFERCEGTCNTGTCTVDSGGACSCFPSRFPREVHTEEAALVV